MIFKIFVSVCLLGALFFGVRIAIGISERESLPSIESVEATADSIFAERLREIENMSFRQVKKIKTIDVHDLLLARTHQKKEIYIKNLRPELDTAGIILVSIFHEIMGDDYTPLITSANDYAFHKKTSAHYRNMALDFRLKGIPNYKKHLITQRAKNALGRRYFVQHEFPGEEMEHLHIELKK